jgi:hypothetical protein
MLDGDELGRNGKDRILVRPYIKEAEPDSIGTRELPTVRTAADEPGPVVPPAPERTDAAADAQDKRMVMWLVGAGLAVVVAAAVAIFALWPSGDDDRSGRAQPAPGVSLNVNGGGPAASAGPSGRASVPASPTPTGTARLSLPAPPPGGTATGQPGGSAAAPPAATLAPPPAGDLVGAITGPGGHCLDVGGIGLPGSPATARACNGTPSQRWTVAADGTLRAGGMCAKPDGGEVHLLSCTADQSGQWRAGPGDTLVNLGGNQCLTDPDDGSRTGGRMRLAACGAAGQRWKLP